jgi:RNA polymerase sigma factor (sigma-70 family)
MDYSNTGRPRDIQATVSVLDADGLAAFVEANYPRLIGLAGLVCRGEVEPADVVQSALELAWRHRANLRDADRLRPWLDRILVREALRLLRRRFRFLVVDPRGEARELELAARPGVEPAEWAGLRAAFDALSREQRAVIALHLYAGYSVEETASMTGAGVETTRSRLRLAKQRLRTQMSEAES